MVNQRLRLALLADAGHVNVQRWHQGLMQAGADVEVISFRLKGPEDKRTHRLPVGPLPGKLHYVFAAPYLRGLIKRIQPDVVIAYYLTGYGLLGALANHRPFVLVSAGSDVLTAPKHLGLRRLVRFALSRADLVTAWAPHMASALQELGVEAQRLLVLPRGIPIDQFTGARAARPGQGDSVNIISTRSLERDYNAHLLLRAIKELHDRGVKASLTLAGDGIQRDELRSLADDLGIGRYVQLAGFVPNDKLPSLLARHNVYVSVIESDGVSASLLEAMAAGLLPIVHDNDANRSWIAMRENGLLLRDLCPPAIAQTIMEGMSDLLLRRRAWSQNESIVRTRGDLFKNAAIFVDRFRSLARQYCC